MVGWSIRGPGAIVVKIPLFLAPSYEPLKLSPLYICPLDHGCSKILWVLILCLSVWKLCFGKYWSCQSVLRQILSVLVDEKKFWKKNFFFVKKNFFLIFFSKYSKFYCIKIFGQKKFFEKKIFFQKHFFLFWYKLGFLTALELSFRKYSTC